MQIEISNQHSIWLAQRFAEVIHARVISQHLYLIADEHERVTVYRRPSEEDLAGRFAEMRTAIRSIRDPWERRDFIRSIRYCFRRLREEKRTDIRGRDYVARVMKFKAENAS